MYKQKNTYESEASSARLVFQSELCNGSVFTESKTQHLEGVLTFVSLCHRIESPRLSPNSPGKVDPNSWEEIFTNVVCGRVEIIFIYICELDILDLHHWVDGHPCLFLTVDIQCVKSINSWRQHIYHLRNLNHRALEHSTTLNVSSDDFCIHIVPPVSQNPITSTQKCGKLASSLRCICRVRASNSSTLQFT